MCQAEVWSEASREALVVGKAVKDCTDEEGPVWR
jgi:hypothetical protein